jgi:hypothetical protein
MHVGKFEPTESRSPLKRRQSVGASDHMRAVNDHLDNVVRPALRNYIEVERALDRANHSKDAATIDAARGDVMLRSLTLDGSEVPWTTGDARHEPR